MKQEQGQRRERTHLIEALKGKGAHIDLEGALAHLPAGLRGRKSNEIPHSIWELVEHVRITQADILDFCINEHYEELNWPEDYWPKSAAPENDTEWKTSLTAWRRDREHIEALVSNADADLNAPLPHGDGQTLLREAILVVDHTGYHIGQIVTIRQMLGNWPPKGNS